MLWADKYRPKELSFLDYHKQQAIDLRNLTKEGDFPHLLVYGPLGAGKKTRIMCLLREIYGPGVDRLKPEVMNFTTPSNKKIEINTVSSNYHIELSPSDVGINDRVVIMDVIKSVAQTQQLNINSQREFKVILLSDVDNLTKDAQHALRRTMEKYISNCRIILCTTSISRVIPAIRSRCLCVRIPAPTHQEIITILTNVCSKESFDLPPELAKEISIKSNRNLRRALLMCEAVKVENQKFDPKLEISEPDWMIFIKNIAEQIIKEQSISVLSKLRDRLYELIIFGIPSDIIFSTLTNEMIQKSDLDLAKQIVEQASFYEHRVQQGNKEIFHLEAFVARCMCLYQNMIQEMAACEF